MPKKQQPNNDKPKFIKGKYENFWQWLGFDGSITGNKIVFTINVAPGDLEIDDPSPNDLICGIDDYMTYLDALKTLLSKFIHEKEVSIESDFYWDEGDLLIRIYIPKTHPYFKLPDNEKAK